MKSGGPSHLMELYGECCATRMGTVVGEWTYKPLPTHWCCHCINDRFGSRLFKADYGDWGNWQLFPANESDVNIYESSRMFLHGKSRSVCRLSCQARSLIALPASLCTGDDIFLIARRDPDGVYWNKNISDLPFMWQHDLNLAAYSLRPHRSSIWRLNREKPALEYLFDIPGCGDTTFPAIIRIGKHKYLVANYTSPTDKCANWSWIEGQISPDGTHIYLTELEFVPSTSPVA